MPCHHTDNQGGKAFVFNAIQGLDQNNVYATYH